MWAIKARPPPKSKKSSQVTEIIIDYSDSQLLPSDDCLFCDPNYPIEDYVHDFFHIKGIEWCSCSNSENFQPVAS